MSDLISRQEVLNKLNVLDQQELYLPCHIKEFVIDEVSNIPPKTGRWIDDCGGVKCSCCGYYIDDNYYAKNYCTNCGAKMEGEVK